MTEHSVVVVVPDESSLVTDASGRPHNIEIDETGRRIVRLPTSTARTMLNGGLPCCIPWREANMALAERLGPPPKLEPGLNIAATLAAQRAAVPRRPLDIWRAGPRHAQGNDRAARMNGHYLRGEIK